MFYSHEILTSRKYGVATVWLVATLGAKSGTKKLTRKAILDVKIDKACETIMTPEAPMALRLQSNLLYGVSRVYDQQCGYVLSDALAAQNQIRALLKVVKSTVLDATGMQARPEQIMLMDDPAFNPDMALPALDFDFGLEIEPEGDSQRSTQSMLSIRERSGSVSSARSAPGIHLPSSSHGDGFQYNDRFGNSSMQKAIRGTAHELPDDEPLLYDDVLGFEFGEDGEMRDISVHERRIRQVDPFRDSPGAILRVRKHHEDGRVLPELDAAGDFNMDYGDDLPALPDTEPLSISDGSGKRPGLLEAERYSQDASSEFIEARQKRRKPKVPKKLAADRTTELRNADLHAWQNGYLKNMTADRLIKNDKKAAKQAKKNAAFFVLGSGINGVGIPLGASHLPIASPLDIFSGAALLALVTGNLLPTSSPSTPHGKKRARSIIEEASPKRPRLDDEEIGRGFDDDAAIHMDNTSQLEIGRDAASALNDAPSSAFPWNVSASLNSHARGATSSIGARRRLTSASPLLGRSAPLSHFDVDEVMYGRDDVTVFGDRDGEDDDAVLRRRGVSVGGMSSSQAAAEFELFGASAAVDTQTAATSQWVREAWDQESGNFLEFVRNSIEEKEGDELSLSSQEESPSAGDGHSGEEGNRKKGKGKEKAHTYMVREKHVTFEGLFDPKSNTCVVAAQAFYHVLTLATKCALWVEQDVGGGKEAPEPWGEIRIGVIA